MKIKLPWRELIHLRQDEDGRMPENGKEMLEANKALIQNQKLLEF